MDNKLTAIKIFGIEFNINELTYSNICFNFLNRKVFDIRSVKTSNKVVRQMYINNFELIFFDNILVQIKVNIENSNRPECNNILLIDKYEHEININKYSNLILMVYNDLGNCDNVEINLLNGIDSYITKVLNNVSDTDFKFEYTFVLRVYLKENLSKVNNIV